MKKSRPDRKAVSFMVILPPGNGCRVPKHTNDEAFHFLLSQNVDVQRLLQLIVELVSSASGGHDT